jgi:site-specific recombinase XerC
MMNGGDLYELAKLLGHANIKMTERYAKLGRAHITKTGTTAKVIWSMMKRRRKSEHRLRDVRVLFARLKY